jgi:hypothetical protein
MTRTLRAPPRGGEKEKKWLMEVEVEEMEEEEGEGIPEG